MDARQRELENKLLGSTIARLREKRGLSQAQLAETLGVHTNTVGNHEKGVYSVGLLDAVAYAEVLGVTLDALARHKTDKADDVLRLPRSEDVYFIDPEAMDVLRKARRGSELKPFLVKGFSAAVVIEPHFEMVSAEQFLAVHKEIVAKVRTLGGFSDRWFKAT